MASPSNIPVDPIIKAYREQKEKDKLAAELQEALNYEKIRADKEKEKAEKEAEAKAGKPADTKSAAPAPAVKADEKAAAKPAATPAK